MNEKGLQLHPRKSRRHPAQHLTDLDFADDLTLATEAVSDAESLLQSLEESATLVGLYCNEGKTEYIRTSSDTSELKSLSGKTIKRVEDFIMTSLCLHYGLPQGLQSTKGTGMGGMQ